MAVWAHAHYLLGRAYLQNHASELAEDSFADALEQNPRHEGAAEQYARMQMAKGNFARAAEALKPAVGGNTQSAASVLLVQAHLAASDWSKAAEAANNLSTKSDRPVLKIYAEAFYRPGQGRACRGH